jgi:serine/threonine protein phosphatase PrpC
MFDITIATCSERGQREANEDDLRSGRAGWAWYAVLADGAGGHEHGAEASRRVVDHLETALQEAALTFTPEHLTQAVLEAHAELQREQEHAQGQRRMHSTVVALWIDAMSDRALWSHVGDSRLYRLRYGEVDLVTSDDSVVQRMVEGGLLTPQQARDHPMKNQLIAALGMQDGVEPNTVTQAIELDDGDAFLLCSDGWWGSLNDTDIAQSLVHAATPQEWLDAMRERVLSRDIPAQDNFSAIAVWVSDSSESTRTMPDMGV